MNLYASPLGHLFHHKFGHVLLPDGTHVPQTDWKEHALAFGFDTLTGYSSVCPENEAWLFGAVQVAANVEHVEDYFITLAVGEVTQLQLPLSPDLVNPRPIKAIHIRCGEDFRVSLSSTMTDRLGKGHGADHLNARFLGLHQVLQ